MAGSNQGGGGSSDEGRRPTKAERQAEARLQREEIQRRMASRRRNRTIGLVLVVLAVHHRRRRGLHDVGRRRHLRHRHPVGGHPPLPGGRGQRRGRLRHRPGDPQLQRRTRRRPTDRPRAHRLVTERRERAGTIDVHDDPARIRPHDPTPLPAGIYDSPPAFYSTIHSLAPYDYPEQGDAGQLPAGVQMALVAWHRLQTCSGASLPVAFDFSSRYEFPGFAGRTYEGVAREPEAPI